MVADIYDELRASTGFEWDDGNAPKLRARHGVDAGECEQAFFNEPFLAVFDDKHSATEPRWQALGRTTAGRGLFIAFTMRGSLIRVISARDMSRREERIYEQAKASLEEDPDVQV